MTRCTVYLELTDDGRCVAHVPDLPGCFVRASERAEALNRLPDAIRSYHAWLAGRGEPVPVAEGVIEWEVAEEISGLAPLDPGDAAALFTPDRESLSAEEMERYFQLMDYSRTDLMDLVRDLPDDLLDWQPTPQSFSVRRLLRHVGNAEEWYVSRLVPRASLPPEWDRDEDLPLLDFMEMERRTAVERLRQLTEAERSGLFYPSHWTQHPEELWTARKALRRFLEHEREHTVQVCQILAAWRLHLLACLAAERVELLWACVGLDEPSLTRVLVFDDWTVKDVLAHVAAWDALFAERIEWVAAGRGQEVAGVDPEERNAAFHAERKGWPLERVLADLSRSRAALLAGLAKLSDEALHRRRRFAWSGQASARQWLEMQAGHDADHFADLVAWRRAEGLAAGAGPKGLLLAALVAARESLLAAADLVPATERGSRLVCGEWTLEDVLGHVADWQLVGIDGLRDMAAGRAPRIEHVESIEAWNQAHARARQVRPWERVWADFEGAFQTFFEMVQESPEAHLSRPFTYRWDRQGSPYRWVCIFVHHEREHAEGLRHALESGA